MFSNRTTTLPSRADRRLVILAAVVGLVAVTVIRILPGPTASTASSAAGEIGLPAAPTVPAAADVRTLANDVRAARQRHDRRASTAFTRQLSELVGPAAVGDAEDAYQAIVANIAAARAQHDRRALARFRLQLAALCRPGSIASGLEPCDADAP